MARNINDAERLTSYRAKAQEAEEAAAKSVDAKVRARLLKIAEGYRSIASYLEKSKP